jgi:predicted ATP-grasp superfamily ATP-dependent carboligase
MDFGTRDDGSHGLLEVNPRISGSVASGMSAGVNVLSLLLHLVKGMDLPDVQPAYGANAIPVHRMCFFRNSSNAG